MALGAAWPDGPAPRSSSPPPPAKKKVIKKTAARAPAPPARVEPALRDRLLAGPLKSSPDIIFCARKPNPTDGHWYANLGYYAHDANRKAWVEGAKLYRWNSATNELKTLVDDPRGGVRDPVVSHDGKTVLFCYRPGGTEQFHLYTIDPDGSNLKQLTDGEYDDIEPAYLPDGSIVFVSTRCKRWVNCWLTQVATLHRCDADGKNVRAISSNNEHDNTPWPLPDGRILYTRWEYVDRSQVDYHHLWAANPDGTGQMIWYGNLHPGVVMIDAKPIPGSEKVVAIFSPGHGIREHAGPIAVVDPKGGPDAKNNVRVVAPQNIYRDPWAFDENTFMAVRNDAIVAVGGENQVAVLLKLPDADLAAGMMPSEPRPLAARPRERIVPDRIEPASATGQLMLANIYEGRNLDGIQPGEIKKLLVLESLPMPIHYTGGMDPISYGGSFTLERVVGTVPVEPDGSAYMDLPALRSFFFVALDKDDLAVKRMQSFLTVQPGEVTSCVGCHEQRTRAPQNPYASLTAMAVRRPPSRIEPVPGVPEVFDYPRDVQPVLDALCVRCHGTEATPDGGPRAGRLLLTGDRGPMFSHSYYQMTIAHLFVDGRNKPVSNYAPRALGSSASRLLKLIDGSHHGVKATPEQARLLRTWIDAGATYPGTYAALGCGMIGHYQENEPINGDFDWPTSRAGASTIDRRCVSCHREPGKLLPRVLADERGVSFWQPSMTDPRLNTSRHIVFNLTKPEKSMILLAPLAKSAGGWGLCRDPDAPEKPIFADTADPDYQTILTMVQAGKTWLDEKTRFDMPNFKPRIDWVREMVRYGILPPDAAAKGPIDVYATERAYWGSLWYHPPKAE
jgi:cytochrome c553